MVAQLFMKTKKKLKKKRISLLQLSVLITAFCLFIISCGTPVNEAAQKALAEQTKEEANIKMYSHVWDGIINKRRLDMFNDSNFTENVVMHVSPKDAVGIDSARAYYANYLTGFSNITFTIKDVFSQGDKLVKHWNFKGTHTGIFFGIPASGKMVNVDGVTLVRIEKERLLKNRIFSTTWSLCSNWG